MNNTCPNTSVIVVVVIKSVLKNIRDNKATQSH